MFTRDATRQPRILALVISYSIPTIINLVKEHHRFLCKQRACCASPRDNTRDSNVVKQSSSVSLASPLISLTRYFHSPSSTLPSRLRNLEKLERSFVRIKRNIKYSFDKPFLFTSISDSFEIIKINNFWKLRFCNVKSYRLNNTCCHHYALTGSVKNFKEFFKSLEIGDYPRTWPVARKDSDPQRRRSSRDTEKPLITAYHRRRLDRDYSRGSELSAFESSLRWIPRVAWTVCVNDQTAEEMFVHCDIAWPLSRYANVQHVCRRTPAP